MTTLAEKYRPTTFEEFKGSELTVQLLLNMLESKSIPSCLMFTGPRGCGKTTMARLVNAYLNEGTDDPLTYVEVDAASNNGVEEIRSLQSMIKYSHGGQWRVVVLDEVHSLSQAAFNAFLKTLEEPPPFTVFILITTKPETIPDTVKSRSMTFRFHGVDVKSIARRTAEVAMAEGIKIKDPHVYLSVANAADGSLRNALVLLEQLNYFPEITVNSVDELSGDVGAGKSLLYAMLSGSLMEFESELTSVFSRTFIIEKVLRSMVASLREFHRNGMITNAQLLSSMEVVWGLRKVYGNVDSQARAMLEAGLFYLFSKSFWNGEENEESHTKESPISDLDIENL